MSSRQAANNVKTILKSLRVTPRQCTQEHIAFVNLSLIEMIKDCNEIMANMINNTYDY